MANNLSMPYPKPPQVLYTSPPFFETRTLTHGGGNYNEKHTNTCTGGIEFQTGLQIASALTKAFIPGPKPALESTEAEPTGTLSL
jgi:hypothetical protein